MYCLFFQRKRGVDLSHYFFKKLSDIHIKGISKIAYRNGAECLAELEVLRSRGTKVSDEALEFYEKYMRRKY